MQPRTEYTTAVFRIALLQYVEDPITFVNIVILHQARRNHSLRELLLLASVPLPRALGIVVESQKGREVSWEISIIEENGADTDDGED